VQVEGTASNETAALSAPRAVRVGQSPPLSALPQPR